MKIMLKYLLFIVIYLKLINLSICGVINYQHYVEDLKNKCSGNTYYDHYEKRCRTFYGGGIAIYVDHSTRCSDNFIGLKIHPKDETYYYVCKKDSVIIGKCRQNQQFNEVTKKCQDKIENLEQKLCRESNVCNLPKCTKIGRFDVPTNTSYFYICEVIDGNWERKIFKCPGTMKFNPLINKCSYNTNISPTKVIDTINEPIEDIDPFPACRKPGRFRTSTDCSKYYTCSAKTNGVFYQTRFRCPDGMFYDLIEEKCCPANEVICKYMTPLDLIDIYDSIQSLKTIEKKYPISYEKPFLLPKKQNIPIHSKGPYSKHMIENILDELSKMEGIGSIEHVDYIDLEDNSENVDSSERNIDTGINNSGELFLEKSNVENSTNKIEIKSTTEIPNNNFVSTLSSVLDRSGTNGALTSTIDIIPNIPTENPTDYLSTVENLTTSIGPSQETSTTTNLLLEITPDSSLKVFTTNDFLTDTKNETSYKSDESNTVILGNELTTESVKKNSVTDSLTRSDVITRILNPDGITNEGRVSDNIEISTGKVSDSKLITTDITTENGFRITSTETSTIKQNLQGTTDNGISSVKVEKQGTENGLIITNTESVIITEIIPGIPNEVIATDYISDNPIDVLTIKPSLIVTDDEEISLIPGEKQLTTESSSIVTNAHTLTTIESLTTNDYISRIPNEVTATDNVLNTIIGKSTHKQNFGEITDENSSTESVLMSTNLESVTFNENIPSIPIESTTLDTIPGIPVERSTIKLNLENGTNQGNLSTDEKEITTEIGPKTADAHSLTTNEYVTKFRNEVATTESGLRVTNVETFVTKENIPSEETTIGNSSDIIVEKTTKLSIENRTNGQNTSPINSSEVTAEISTDAENITSIPDEEATVKVNIETTTNKTSDSSINEHKTTPGTNVEIFTTKEPRMQNEETESFTESLLMSTNSERVIITENIPSIPVESTTSDTTHDIPVERSTMKLNLEDATNQASLSTNAEEIDTEIDPKTADVHNLSTNEYVTKFHNEVATTESGLRVTNAEASATKENIPNIPSEETTIDKIPDTPFERTTIRLNIEDTNSSRSDSPLSESEITTEILLSNINADMITTENIPRIPNERTADNISGIREENTSVKLNTGNTTNSLSDSTINKNKVTTESFSSITNIETSTTKENIHRIPNIGPTTNNIPDTPVERSTLKLNIEDTTNEEIENEITTESDLRLTNVGTLPTKENIPTIPNETTVMDKIPDIPTERTTINLNVEETTSVRSDPPIYENKITTKSGLNVSNPELLTTKENIPRIPDERTTESILGIPEEKTTVKLNIEDTINGRSDPPINEIEITTESGLSLTNAALTIKENIPRIPKESTTTDNISVEGSTLKLNTDNTTDEEGVNELTTESDLIASNVNTLTTKENIPGIPNEATISNSIPDIPLERTTPKRNLEDTSSGRSDLLINEITTERHLRVTNGELFTTKENIPRTPNEGTSTDNISDISVERSTLKINIEDTTNEKIENKITTESDLIVTNVYTLTTKENIPRIPNEGTATENIPSIPEVKTTLWSNIEDTTRGQSDRPINGNDTITESITNAEILTTKENIPKILDISVERSTVKIEDTTNEEGENEITTGSYLIVTNVDTLATKENIPGIPIETTIENIPRIPEVKTTLKPNIKDTTRGQSDPLINENETTTESFLSITNPEILTTKENIPKVPDISVERSTVKIDIEDTTNEEGENEITTGSDLIVTNVDTLATNENVPGIPNERTTTENIPSIPEVKTTLWSNIEDTTLGQSDRPISENNTITESITNGEILTTKENIPKIPDISVERSTVKIDIEDTTNEEGGNEITTGSDLIVTNVDTLTTKKNIPGIPNERTTTENIPNIPEVKTTLKPNIKDTTRGQSDPPINENETTESFLSITNADILTTNENIPKIPNEESTSDNIVGITVERSTPKINLADTTNKGKNEITTESYRRATNVDTLTTKENILRIPNEITIMDNIPDILTERTTIQLNLEDTTSGGSDPLKNENEITIEGGLRTTNTMSLTTKENISRIPNISVERSTLQINIEDTTKAKTENEIATETGVRITKENIPRIPNGTTENIPDIPEEKTTVKLNIEDTTSLQSDSPINANKITTDGGLRVTTTKENIPIIPNEATTTENIPYILIERTTIKQNVESAIKGGSDLPINEYDTTESVLRNTNIETFTTKETIPRIPNEVTTTVIIPDIIGEQTTVKLNIEDTTSDRIDSTIKENDITTENELIITNAETLTTKENIPRIPNEGTTDSPVELTTIDSILENTVGNSKTTESVLTTNENIPRIPYEFTTKENIPNIAIEDASIKATTENAMNKDTISTIKSESIPRIAEETKIDLIPNIPTEPTAINELFGKDTTTTLSTENIPKIPDEKLDSVAGKELIPLIPNDWKSTEIIPRIPIDGNSEMTTLKNKINLNVNERDSEEFDGSVTTERSKISLSVNEPDSEEVSTDKHKIILSVNENESNEATTVSNKLMLSVDETDSAEVTTVSNKLILSVDEMDSEESSTKDFNLTPEPYSETGGSLETLNQQRSSDKTTKSIDDTTTPKSVVLNEKNSDVECFHNGKKICCNDCCNNCGNNDENAASYDVIHLNLKKRCKLVIKTNSNDVPLETDQVLIYKDDKSKISDAVARRIYLEFAKKK